MQYLPEPLTPVYFDAPAVKTRSLNAAPAQGLELPKSRGLLSFLGKEGAAVDPNELKDQFLLFQLSADLNQPTLLETTQVDPVFEGGSAAPDVLMKVTLESIHIGKGEAIDADTQATVRITVNTDPLSALDRNLEVLFWTIAAGLDLYNLVKSTGKGAQGQVVKLSSYAEEFQRPFAQRPIEIVGGLANFQFEVIKHKPEPWWKRTFNFLESAPGQEAVKLIGDAIGLPGVTGTALRLLEGLFERLSGANSQVLFQGRPLRLALTQFARDQFTGGNPRIRMGSLNPGFAVVARGRDFAQFAEHSFIYLPAYGKLVPAEIADDPEKFLGGYEDPLAQVSYAILRIGMSEASVDPVFLYSPTLV